MEIKFTRILCLELFLVFFSSFYSCSVETVEICRDNNAEAVSVTLELSLSNLTHYEGNCTCRINRINQGGNVTMEADIQIDGCDSLYLEVEKWNYQTSCGEEPGYDHTQFLFPGQFHKIFMKRSLGGSSPTIDGSITFRSLNSDKLVLACEDAEYDIPPSTTTATTTITPVPSQLPTILGIAGGALIGFFILLILICLCIRYRQKRSRAHNAKLANTTGVLPDEDRERIDPEMTRLSWYKSIPFRLKRLYSGESRKNRASTQGTKCLNLDKSAKSLSKMRMGNGDATTGTRGGKTLQRLFRTKSSSFTRHFSSRENSTIEDDIRRREVQDEEPDDEDVFPEVAPQHGGEIFMDSRRTSCETLDQARFDGDYAGINDCDLTGGAGTSDIAGVSVHQEDITREDAKKKDVDPEVEFISSLFDGVPDSASPTDSKVYFDDNYASVGPKESLRPSETSSTESASATKDEDVKTTSYPSPQRPNEDQEFDDDAHFSINGDLYASVNKHKLDVSEIDHANEIDNTDYLASVDDDYAVVDKSSISRKPDSFFRL